MPREFVDLSMYLENDVISDPPPFGPKITYMRHGDTVQQLAGFDDGRRPACADDRRSPARVVLAAGREARLPRQAGWLRRQRARRRAGAVSDRTHWEGHKASRHIGYCHLEKLHNLEALPGDGFTISCFPVKIRGASAGWTRAVAIFD